MLKAKAEKEKAAKEAKDKAAAEEAKKRDEEKAAKAQAEADEKKKKQAEEEEAESKRKAQQEEDEQKAKKEAEEKKAAEDKKVAEEKKVEEEKKQAEEKKTGEEEQQKKEEAQKAEDEKKPAATDAFKAAAGADNDSTPSTPGQEVAGLHVKSSEADAVRAEEDALLADEKKFAEPESKVDPAQALADARENLNADSSAKDVNPVSPTPSSLPSFLPAKPSTDLSKSSTPESSKAATPSSAAISSARPISDLANVSYPESSKAPSSELNVNSEPGKYRYDRDFLLQFMAICQEKPEHLPNLAEMGMVGDENAPRGNFDRRSQRGGAMGPPSRTASSSGAFGRSASMGGVGGAFGGMGNFGQAGSGSSSEQRFAASLNRSTSGAFGGARGSMSRTTSQSGMGGAFSQGGGGRNKSERGSKRRGEKDGQKDDSRKPGQHVAGEGFEDATLGPRSATGWAPSVIAGSGSNVDTNSPEMVQRKVKALLNKLTLERFDSISDQILEWANRSVDESDGRILRQVIALIFEKATDEATWSEMYARLCRKLMERVSTEVRDETVKAQDGTPVAGGALFRKYLLNRCQEDYENGWKNKEAATAAAKSKEADDKAKQDANDAAKKEAEEKGTKEEDQKEAELLSDEYYAAQKAKRRGLGLVRFIGELYRLQMLTERIMHECIKKLLSNTENPEEEDVESLCRLLTTVGKGLDNPKAKQHMDIYFSRMNLIANSPKVSSRIRFMILVSSLPSFPRTNGARSYSLSLFLYHRTSSIFVLPDGHRNKPLPDPKPSRRFTLM
jgi:translation initiation factor 4G